MGIGIGIGIKRAGGIVGGRNEIDPWVVEARAYLYFFDKVDIIWYGMEWYGMVRNEMNGRYGGRR
jgi:hypothetical protein